MAKVTDEGVEKLQQALPKPAGTEKPERVRILLSDAYARVGRCNAAANLLTTSRPTYERRIYIRTGRRFQGKELATLLQGRSRPLPPQAVLGPAFTPGHGRQPTYPSPFPPLSRPFTGVLLATSQEVRKRT